MAIKDWVSSYPGQLDTDTEQPDLTNNEDVTRVSHILTVRDSIQALQSQVGSNNLESGSLRKRISDLEDGYGPYISELSANSLSLADGYDFILSEPTLVANRGSGVELILTPSTSTGQVTIELFQDSSRFEKVAEHVVDLSDAYSYKYYDVFGFSNESSGKLYGSFSCSGVPVSQTASLSLIANIMQPVEDPTPLSDPYGNGIEDDGTGKPRINLATDSGLELDANGIKVKSDLTSDVYVSTGSNGSFVVGAVNMVGDQDISGEKRFDSLGYIPTLGYGPPVTGSWTRGIEILDGYDVKWRCTVSGSPGTWDLVDTVTEQTDVVSSSVVSDGYTDSVELDVYGNAGQALWFRVWGKTSSGSSDVSIPYSVKIYETTSLNGREMVWKGAGLIRQTSTTSSLPASQTYIEVSDNDLFDNEEGVVVYDSDIRYEFARISGRPTGQITLDEALEDASSWGSGSLVLAVTEFFNVPWINRDGSPANQRKIIIEFRHDGDSSDADIVFYVEALAQSRGVLI